jgi:hypothetical protein
VLRGMAFISIPNFTQIGHEMWRVRLEDEPTAFQRELRNEIMFQQTRVYFFLYFTPNGPI